MPHHMYCVDVWYMIYKYVPRYSSIYALHRIAVKIIAYPGAAALNSSSPLFSLANGLVSTRANASILFQKYICPVVVHCIMLGRL